MNHDVFNVAAKPRQHPPVVWLALAVGVVLFAASWHQLEQRWDAQAQAQEQLRALKKMAKRANAAQPVNTPSKSEAQQQAWAHMAWDGVFDSIEVAAYAMRAGVSIISLAPSKVDPSTVEINLTAVASNAPVMLAYLSALQKDPRIQEANLVTQQPDDKTGPGALRFQLHIVVDPSVIVEHPPRPVLPPTPSGITAQGSIPAPNAKPIVPPAVLNQAAPSNLPPLRRP